MRQTTKSDSCWKRDSLKHHGEPRCCCTCKFRKEVFGHPSVNGESVLKRAFFICTGLQESATEKEHITLTNKHGLCECWEQKEVKT